MYRNQRRRWTQACAFTVAALSTRILRINVVDQDAVSPYSWRSRAAVAVVAARIRLAPPRRASSAPTCAARRAPTPLRAVDAPPQAKARELRPALDVTYRLRWLRAGQRRSRLCAHPSASCDEPLVQGRGLAFLRGHARLFLYVGAPSDRQAAVKSRSMRLRRRRAAAGRVEAAASVVDAEPRPLHPPSTRRRRRHRRVVAKPLYPPSSPMNLPRLGALVFRARGLPPSAMPVPSARMAAPRPWDVVSSAARAPAVPRGLRGAAPPRARVPRDDARPTTESETAESAARPPRRARRPRARRPEAAAAPPAPA